MHCQTICYYVLKRLDEADRYNWVTNLKGIMFKYGFGFVWLTQELGCPNKFVEVFKQCLFGCSTQDWHSAVNTSPKLEWWAEFKNVLNVEKYLLVVIPQFSLRKALSL